MSRHAEPASTANQARRWRWLLATLMLTAAGQPAQAAEASSKASPELHAVLFHKIFQYTRTLASKSPMRVLLVNVDAGTAGALQKAFSTAGITTATSSVEALKPPRSAEAIYILEPSAAVRELCEKQQLLLISGSPKLAEQGEAAVALGVRADGRTQILIHLAAAKAQGHEFSSDLLKLATVIR